MADEMDALVPQLAATNAKFVADYNPARIIVDAGGGKAKAKPAPALQTTASKSIQISKTRAAFGNEGRF